MADRNGKRTKEKKDETPKKKPKLLTKVRIGRRLSLIVMKKDQSTLSCSIVRDIPSSCIVHFPTNPPPPYSLDGSKDPIKLEVFVDQTKGSERTHAVEGNTEHMNYQGVEAYQASKWVFDCFVQHQFIGGRFVVGVYDEDKNKMELVPLSRLISMRSQLKKTINLTVKANQGTFTEQRDSLMANFGTRLSHRILKNIKEQSMVVQNESSKARTATEVTLLQTSDDDLPPISLPESHNPITIFNWDQIIPEQNYEIYGVNDIFSPHVFQIQMLLRLTFDKTNSQDTKRYIAAALYFGYIAQMLENYKSRMIIRIFPEEEKVHQIPEEFMQIFGRTFGIRMGTSTFKYDDLGKFKAINYALVALLLCEGFSTTATPAAEALCVTKES
ncbi:hypothetical protein PROFUN_15500 [Planoprotostelium fungivorum]|uniref:Uncharacterized protein n=1 Tax=Planoprotostelium fungivorum TaxID=1890364 RepID=A0A2P6MSP8_9EUKA|nr:hypothetical protein PROFUN_15500 [Planoprotostelium fungivorum]